ncbi:MAG: glycosyltransferase, partial [Gammaproteobacteria bacterium]
MSSPSSISIILPAKNEAENISGLMEKLKSVAPQAEILVVDDGSTDETKKLAETAGAKVISHPYGMGNGA